MKPLLNTVVTEPITAADDLDGDLLRELPGEHRDRLVLAWPGCVARPPLEVIARARTVGFKRVCVRTDSRFDSGTLDALVRAGANELEIRMPVDLPHDRIRSHRSAGSLRHVILSLHFPWAEEHWEAVMPDPCDADELKVECRAGSDCGELDSYVGEASRTYRRISVRGFPLCNLRNLEAGKVLANAMEALVPPGLTDLRFENPERVYLEPCHRCSLALACDGFSYTTLAGGSDLNVRPFDSDQGSGTVETGHHPWLRVHPPTFISGRTHVHGVAAGIRTCGRIVVPRCDRDRQVELLEREGLSVRVVEPGASPEDVDKGAHDRLPQKPVHVFFSRSGERADKAAGIERVFTRAETGAKPMGSETFARTIGKLLGYPECCIAAFVEAGPLATTSDLLRAAHRRSQAFDWRLNCMDPRSPMTLVPHVPCRFDCAPSVEMARRLIRSLPSLFPFLDGTAERLLGRIVFFLDQERAVALDGDLEPDGLGVRYTVVDALGARPSSDGRPTSQDFIRETFPALVSGDRLRIRGREIRVFRGDEVFYQKEFQPEPLLYPFGIGV